MSNAKHTPGPWSCGWGETSGLTGPRCAPTVYLAKADLDIEIPVHRDGRPIAWVLSSLPDERAVPDARLLAAAPELLEALKLVDAEWSTFWPLGPEVKTSSDRICAISDETQVIWRAVRAAIAKATGEQA